MKRLMLFIEPTAAQINIFSQFTLPRLGSFILAGLANRRASWNARVFIEGRERFDLAAWTARHGRPDIVGISTITATVKRGYQLADECRARGIPVVLGGPHVTFLPEEALTHAGLPSRWLVLFRDRHVREGVPISFGRGHPRGTSSLRHPGSLRVLLRPPTPLHPAIPRARCGNRN
ncbi:MAG TPA: cobalamin-dependent protein [Verrucomicrobiota bacterium]|nr:cobalamin-dependent protein [Verrucomicrobiota bacterium]HNU50737.1 cobalamin-dependent protein [Verrucomicrobiota bacterium]